MKIRPIAVTAAVMSVVSLMGCGSVGVGPKPTPTPMDRPPNSSPAVPSGTATPGQSATPGSSVSKDSFVSLILPAENVGAAKTTNQLRVSLNSISQGADKDLQVLDADTVKRVNGYSPYYLTFTVAPGSTPTVGDVNLADYLLPAYDDATPALSLRVNGGKFPGCSEKVVPNGYGPGAQPFTFCVIGLARKGTSIDQAMYVNGDDYQAKPILFKD